MKFYSLALGKAYAVLLGQLSSIAETSSYGTRLVTSPYGTRSRSEKGEESWNLPLILMDPFLVLSTLLLTPITTQFLPLSSHTDTNLPMLVSDCSLLVYIRSWQHASCDRSHSTKIGFLLFCILTIGSSYVFCHLL